MTRTRILVVVGMVGLAISARLARWYRGQRCPGAAAARQAPKAPGIPTSLEAPSMITSIRRSPPRTPMPRFRPHVWTDPKMLAKGKEIFTAKCALCHGEKGDGKGPGSVNLPLKPADLTDAKMVAEMPGNFWVWRVSEGGLVEPFKSKGSAMPAWKGELSMNDRWAVIAYAHTLSGHRGPHVASEHPELKPKPKFVTGEGTVVALRRRSSKSSSSTARSRTSWRPMTMGYKINPSRS